MDCRLHRGTTLLPMGLGLLVYVAGVQSLAVAAFVSFARNLAIHADFCGHS